MKPLHTEYRFKLNAAGFSGILLAARPLISILTTRRRALDDYGAVDGAAAVNIIYTLIILAHCLAVISREREIPYLRMIFGSNLRWFAFFTIWGGITTFWSVNSALTGFRTLECAAFFLLIVIVAAKLIFHHGIKVMFGWFMRWYLLTDCLLRLVQRIFAGGGLDYILSVAQMSAPVFCYLALFHEQSRVIKGLVALLSFLSHSTTSYIGLALGSLGLWFGSGAKKLLALSILAAAVLGLFWLGPYDFLKNTVFHERTEIGWEYTSGRNMIWETAWEYAARRPWGGYGFFAGEPYILYDVGLHAINCHSSFASSLLGTGFIGLFLIALYIFSYIPLLMHSAIPPMYRPALMGCYAVAFCQCLSNPGIGSRIYGSWMAVTILFVMITVSVWYYHQSEEEQEGRS